MNRTGKTWLAASGSALLLATAAMAGGAAGALAQDEKVTVDWWHIQNVEPMKTLWDEAIAAYEAENPNVDIVASVRENEAFKAALTANLAAGDAPDLFQSWGVGTLKEQVDAGFVRPIDDLIGDWEDTVSAGARSLYNIDGSQYAIPFDQGMVGFWYNKDLFAAAGIDEFPTTWSGLLDAVQALKDSGVIPITIGQGEKWPGHFWFAYLALRNCGFEELAATEADGNWNRECIVKAGQDLQDLVDLEPFQPDFLASTYGDATGSPAWLGNGEAAMELMGHWAANNYVQFSASGEGIGDALAFTSFPEVEGGAGTITDAFGGGNGFAVGIDAPDEAIDFLRYISSLEVQSHLAEAGRLLPVTIGASDSVVDPNLQTLSGILADSTSVTLYLDQALPPAVGEAINDSVAELFGGAATPEEVATAITEAQAAE